MKVRKAAGYIIISLLTAVFAVALYSIVVKPETRYVEVEPKPAVREVSLPSVPGLPSMDFIGAAESSIHGVVHVKTTEFINSDEINPLYKYFFGVEDHPVMGFGSGVIISKEGYIVTNNHVIEGSDEIEITMNDRRTYPAKLIGADPWTDLALIKIEAEDLSVIPYGNSDHLKLGEWVLAVGNPYNLTSTVTAGIVSAKGRDINLLRSNLTENPNLAIESFIQTDAAVNPGNSGGALVNTNGELVGINTAIASRTGNYTGYSFAIPVSIVKKVVGDLKEYGEVQRAFLGVSIATVTAELAKEEGLKNINGVFISDLQDNGAARESGIKIGDVITSVNEVKVNTVAELQEQISRYRPNDIVDVQLERKGDVKHFSVRLRNMHGNTEIVRTDNIIDVLGASFEPLSAREKQEYKISSGIKVSSVKSGKFMKVGIEKGFIITSINKRPVNSVKDITEILQGVDGGVIIEGINHDGSKSYYAFGM